MTGFAKLVPAFTALVPIEKPLHVGVTAAGQPLTAVAFTKGEGSIRSESGYPIALDGVWVHGVDNIRANPDGKHIRLDVDSLAEDKKTGGLVRFRYTGIADISGPAGKVLTGAGDAMTTDFGEVFTHAKFETGHPDLKELENKVYVGSGCFVLEGGKVFVEYKISEVSF